MSGDELVRALTRTLADLRRAHRMCTHFPEQRREIGLRIGEVEAERARLAASGQARFAIPPAGGEQGGR